MTVFDDEMMKALEADGEKLRQLTGEDHGPVFFHETPKPDACDHDWSGERDIYDTSGFGGAVTGCEAYCVRCGMGAMQYSILMDNE